MHILIIPYIDLLFSNILFFFKSKSIKKPSKYWWGSEICFNTWLSDLGNRKACSNAITYKFVFKTGFQGCLSNFHTPTNNYPHILCGILIMTTIANNYDVSANNYLILANNYPLLANNCNASANNCPVLS